jgi:RNA polymerase sigma factor (TIGR02999 family)
MRGADKPTFLGMRGRSAQIAFILPHHPVLIIVDPARRARDCKRTSLSCCFATAIIGPSFIGSWASSMPDVTQILSAIEQGDGQAADRLLPLVYDELRRLAAHQLANEKPGQTLQPTALVHEAYLRLLGNDSTNDPTRTYNDRGHFFAAAATAMRRIMIDSARRKKTRKHGGGLKRQPLEHIAESQNDEELLALDEALEKLAAKDPMKARLVELRYFAGLTGDEAAAVLGISPTTADRHWAFARAWLQTEVRRG